MYPAAGCPMLALWCICFFILTISVAGDGSCSRDNNDVDPTVMKWIEELPTENSLYMNGDWVRPTSNGAVIGVVDPSTGKNIALVSVASKSDVGTAVDSARQALEGWAIDTTLDKRRQLVSKLLDLYNENAEQMAQLIAHEMGAPIDLSRDAQVSSGSAVIEQFLHETSANGNFKSEYQLDDGDTMIYHEAIGVVGLITPWNWPMNQITLKVIPALLVGCTVILKPSEQTPLSALLFGQLMHDAGFPPGVFQLVNGHGPNDVGEWLASHPNIDMVSFTGSTTAGREISLAAAATVKRVSLEMGGKGANIIFGDIISDDNMDDFEAAIDNGVWDVMSNSGQTCNAPTRMLIPKEHWDFALVVATNTAMQIQVGSAKEEGEHIGPVVNKAQYERIQAYIQSGIDQGATLLVGGLGKPIKNDSDDIVQQQLQQHYQGGYYVKPTIFANCTPEMTIWTEEIFGPVLCMTSFETEEGAIKLANDSPYGLMHYAHTYDTQRRLRLAKKLQSGMIVFNQVWLASSAPFGGMKQSGNSREGGEWGLLDFCVVKAISGILGDEYYQDSDDA